MEYSFGSSEDVEFLVTNNWVTISHPPPFLLNVFDTELRYPTQTALAIEAGFLAQEGWDGWIRLLKRPSQKYPQARCPTGLLSILIRFTEKFGFTYRIHDQRDKHHGDIPDIVNIPLRDYQQKAVELALAAGRGVIDCPPRSGKTRLGVELVRRLALPTVWIAPTSRIVEQTGDVLVGFHGQGYAAILVGMAGWEKVAKRRVVVCTAATAINLPDEFWATRQVLLIDEFHHAGAKSYSHIFQMCPHIYYRYGMTGTFFRSGEDTLAMHALLANTIYKITPRELVERGFLVPVKVVFLPVVGRLMGVGGKSFQSGHGKAGIHEHVYRQSMVAHTAYYLQWTGRRVLVLVGTKKQGRDLLGQIRALVPRAPDTAEYQSCMLVTSDTKRDQQASIIASFVGGREVKVLIGTSLVGEGVDLPSTDALVYARGEKAEVGLVQNAYRVATAVEGKQHAVIVDFADRHNAKLLAHAKERLRIYHEEPTFDVSVLQDANEFPLWLDKLDRKPADGVIQGCEVVVTPMDGGCHAKLP